MKELSIKEKAKRYDEAIERAKEMIKAMNNIGGVAKVDDIQYLFHELKESEDERIRKDIINLVKKSNKYGGYALHKWEADKMLAWLEKQDEQKPTWSAEDERHFSWLIEHLSQSAGLYDNLIDWLKSLKDRVQPKVELTQLDKNILEAAIAFVELNNHFNCWRGVNKHTVVSALHSLEPQNTWKPSDEQMKQLSWIANQNKDNMIGKELMMLYNDLKKLR